MLFKEFIRHYRKMNDEQIVEDVKQSMDDLDDLNEDGESFGSKMVKWSNERKNQYPQAAENGAKGGRPRISQESPPNPQASAPVARSAAGRGPRTKLEFETFIYEPSNNINTAMAWEWYDIHKARDWTDKAGAPLTNWKGALTNYCRSREKK